MDWKSELSKFIRTPADLVSAGILSPEQVSKLVPIISKYRLTISPYYASLIERGNEKCPIFLQAVPLPDEAQAETGFEADPLEDSRYLVAPRLTYRLKGRALLHVVSLCSTYCRFCFRKTLLNESKEALFSGDYEAAFSFLRGHPEIKEIILTGGDPFMLSDSGIREILGSLKELGTIPNLRVHTRVPVTFPSRIDEGLLETLKIPFEKKIVVTHFNHPKELTSEAIASCRRLEGSGFSVWNQSVLLKRINDDPQTLVELVQSLVRVKIKPYYLHHPDRSQGTSHFFIPLAKGLAIYRKACSQWPSTKWPRYVVDRLGPEGKVDIPKFSSHDFS